MIITLGRKIKKSVVIEMNINSNSTIDWSTDFNEFSGIHLGWCKWDGYLFDT